MSTPKDQERARAFRAWARAQASEAAARACLGINPRSFARMFSGTKPPSPAMLEQLAGDLPDGALRDALLAAAAPAEPANA